MSRRPGAAVTAALAFAALLARPAAAEERDPLPIPDLPGLKTLKGDFHLHTVFSDGHVWPTVHVREAWRDGLDVLALTDHVEYHPHAADVKADLRRPYEVARPLAEELGLILVPGVEITRPAPGTPPTIPVGSGHFNALFVTDPAALDVPDLKDALRAARTQGAYVFWNHPGFMRRLEPRWHPHVAEAHREGLFQGMELVNGEDFYEQAYPWIAEKGLAILANSDSHQPLPPRSAGGSRAITLLFTRSADLEGVREALLARRTAAWLGDEVWGAEEHLRGLWEGAIGLETEAVRSRPGQTVRVRVRNSSALPFRLRARAGPEWLRITDTTVPARATALVDVTVAGQAPAGTTRVSLDLEVVNLHTAPGRNLHVSLPLAITVAAAVTPTKG